MQMLTHSITKRLINTKMAKWINSYFINGASHKHSNYIFVNKSSYFFYNSGVRVKIWTLLFFMASFDISNLRGQMENLKFIQSRLFRLYLVLNRTLDEAKVIRGAPETWKPLKTICIQNLGYIFFGFSCSWKILIEVLYTR